MKRFGVILLLVLLLGVTFSKWLIITEFGINRNYIAKNLCENRNKPKSCCKGKCFLGKQLQHDEQDNNSNSTTKNTSLEIQLFWQHQPEVETSKMVVVTQSPSGQEPSFTNQLCVLSLIKPPGVCG